MQVWFWRDFNLDRCQRDFNLDRCQLGIFFARKGKMARRGFLLSSKGVGVAVR